MYSVCYGNLSAKCSPPPILLIVVDSKRALPLRPDLVLPAQLEVAGVVALAELGLGVALQAVDDAAALHGRAGTDLVGPAVDVLVVLHRQEPGRTVEQALGEAAVPRPHRDVGDRVVVAAQEPRLGEAAIEHVELAPGLHREAVDGVFDPGRRPGVDVAEAAAGTGRAAHLPEEPGQDLGAHRVADPVPADFPEGAVCSGRPRGLGSRPHKRAPGRVGS